MKRLLLLAALCMALALVFAQVAVAQSRGPSGADGTYNCEDFDDQGQAQEFSLGDPGDTNGLDEDGDGTVCESLPTIMDDGTPDGSAVPGAGESSASPDASASAEPCNGGPTRVTPDGIQCSDLPDVIPSATAEADDGSSSATASASALPETGGISPALALAPLALLLGSGLLALRVMRRG